MIGLILAGIVALTRVKAEVAHLCLSEASRSERGSLSRLKGGRLRYRLLIQQRLAKVRLIDGPVVDFFLVECAAVVRGGRVGRSPDLSFSLGAGARRSHLG